MARHFSIKGALSQGWATFTKRPLFFVGVFLLLIGVSIVLQLPSMALDFITPEDLEGAGGATVTAVAFAVWGGIIFSLIAWVVQQYLALGVVRLSIEAVRGRTVSFSTLVVEPKTFVNYLLATILVTVIVLLGLLFFIIPGIYLSLALSLVVYVVIDKKIGPVEALQQGWNLTKGNRGWLFLFGLLLGGINLLGALALLVGLLVTVPLTWLAMADVYRQLADKRS